MKKASIALTVSALLAVMALSSIAQRSPESPAVSPSSELTKDLLAQGWPGVLRCLDAKKVENLSSVERFIQGHACIAENRDNEALQLFWSTTTTKSDIKEWLRWTGRFSAENPKSAVGALLHGDALARNSQNAEAISEFTRGLTIDPKNDLLLNARGVCYACRLDSTRARTDFRAAAGVNPNLADAFVNVGGTYIRECHNAKVALTEFEKALSIEADFKLANIGKASAYYGIGRYSDAASILQPLVKDTYCSAIAIPNLYTVQGCIDKSLLLAVADSEVGSTINVAGIASELQSIRTQTAQMQVDLAAHQASSAMPRAAFSFLDHLADVVLPISDAAHPSIGFKGIWSFSPDFTALYHAITQPLRQYLDPFAAADAVKQQSLANSQIHRPSASNTLTSPMSATDTLAAVDTALQQSIANSQIHRQSIISALPSSITGPGGVNFARIAEAISDHGNWQMLVRFTLQYPLQQPPAAPSANSESTSESKGTKQ